jgi:hypothetical protein
LRLALGEPALVGAEHAALAPARGRITVVDELSGAVAEGRGPSPRPLLFFVVTREAILTRSNKVSSSWFFTGGNLIHGGGF